jgi:Tol biopolymer transport system component/tRNA A-37 threonylcarbamoyl transferase component Bud32
MSAAAQLNSALLGRYRVERMIGRGGMATVFLADDLKHERRVALKVLDPELGALLGIERFLAEIRVTARLQHPNLLPLFDSGEANGLLFYVMPYVAGQSLRARLDREKQLPIDECVRIAVAVASALDYAHRHNVIHRDLKPENILLHDGQPLVADFGIALAVTNAGGTRVTQTGISLGTPQYMSPEQATGDRQLDSRSDIYSLGAVLYEMLTGEPPYSGTTAQAVIAKMLTDEPRRIRLSRPTVPEQIEIATEHALAKLPADRFQKAHQFADALQGRGVSIPAGVSTPSSVRSTLRPPSLRARLRDPVALVLAALLLGVTTAAVWLSAEMRRVRDDPVTRLSLALPPEMLMTGTGGRAFDISADGGTVVYSGVLPSGGNQVFVRRLNDLQMQVIPGSSLALDPSISPDGRWIAYASGTQLYKVSIDGGPALPVGNAALLGTAWVDNETIAGVRDGSIWLFPANGQPARRLTTLDTTTSERSQSYPIATPDGKHLFYQTLHDAGTATVRLGVASVETGRTATLSVIGVTAIGMIGDALIYARSDGAVMGIRMDLANLRTVGDAIPLGEQVSIVAGGVARAALSRGGTLIYQRGATLGQLNVLDSSGALLATLGEPETSTHPRFSPDGRRVAVSFDGDVWIYDLASATPMRLTSGARNDRPEWTADGQRILFRTTRDGADALWWQRADGSTGPERLLRLDNGPQEGVITPDGKWLVVRTIGTTTKRDVRYRAMSGDTTLYPIAASEFDELMPRVSPDGKWIAYISDESGIVEVYVRSFPGPSGKVQVSLGGGSEPIWAPDGRRIYYRRARDVMAASLSTSSGFSVRERTKLFEGAYATSPIHANFDVSPDGKRFLMINRASSDAEVIIVHNWAREVRERLRERR